MALREDSDSYCIIWIGLLLLGAYYANFGYMVWTDLTARAAFFGNFFSILILLALPPLMIVLFTGYLRPARGKAKMSMLGPSVLSGLFFVIISYQVSVGTDILGNLIVFSSWGIGSALLTAGGFSIMHPMNKSVNDGMLDVSLLHYRPEPAEEKADEETTEQTAPAAVAADDSA